MARKVGNRPAGPKGAPRAGKTVTAKDRPWGSWAFFGIIGVVAAVFIAFAAVQSVGSNGGSTDIEGVASYENLSRQHVTTDVSYPQSPPVGGRHAPVWLDCTGTVYEKPVLEEKAVHGLEHGAVWVSYRPGDVSDEQVQQLRGHVSGTDYRFVSPRPDQPAPVMATAWGKQLKLDSADDPRLEKFLAAYTQGPQTPEPGATCAGGGMMR